MLINYNSSGGNIGPQALLKLSVWDFLSSNEKRTKKQTFEAEQEKAKKGACRGDIKIMPKE